MLEDPGDKDPGDKDPGDKDPGDRQNVTGEITGRPSPYLPWLDN
jgi:hypothetical protein